MRHLVPQFRLALVGLSLAVLTTVSAAHVDGATLADLPMDGESGGPWVMGEGEGAHLMLPIR